MSVIQFYSKRHITAYLHYSMVYVEMQGLNEKRLLIPYEQYHAIPAGLLSIHFSIITDVPDLKRNSIKTSHTFTSLSSFLTSVPSNFVLVRGWELMKLQSACIRSRCSALAASSILVCSCCSRSRSISSTRSS